MKLELFRQGDVYIDDPYQDTKFRYEKKTGKVFARNYGEAEHEISYTFSSFRDAMSSGKVITREEYLKD